MRVTVVGALTVLLIALVAPAIQSGSNCGGNSAALAHVRKYQAFASVAASKSPDHIFAVTSATPEQLQALAELARNHWTHDDRYLVSTLPYRGDDPGPRRILMVCERPYRNVPRRVLFQAPPTHAASFSDGSIGLISVEEFAALDRSTIVPLDELLGGSSHSPPNQSLQRTRPQGAIW